MKKLVFTLTLFLIVNFSFYVAVAQVGVLKNSEEEKTKEQGYYYAFTEATKMYLLGDFRAALNLYMECLRYRPESQAASFQVSLIYLKSGDLDNAKTFAKRAYSGDLKNEWYGKSLAQIYEMDMQLDSALLIYKAIDATGEDGTNLQFMIASIYERLNKPEDAMVYLDSIENKIGFTREVAVSKSRVYNMLNHRTKAVNELYKALKISSEDYIVLGMIAEHYRNIAESDSAYKYYRRAISFNAENANVYLSYGEFLLEQRMFDSAKVVFIKFVDNDAIDNSLKARYFYSLVQEPALFKLARPVLDTTVSLFYSLQPKDIRVKSLYSDLQYRLGNYRKAADALLSILDEDDNNNVVWEQLLLCLNFLGELDSILFYGESTMARFNNRPLAFMVTGSAYYQKKEYYKSASVLEKGLLLTDNDALIFEFQVLLAECYNSLSEYVKAEDFFKRALAIEKENPAINNNYAYFLAVQEKELTDAKKMSKLSLQKDPDSSVYLDTYGWILFKQDKERRDLKYLQKALAKGGNESAEILDHYGDVLHSLGKDDLAKEAWENALRYADVDLQQRINEKLKLVGGLTEAL